jgi:hypothetical protein
MEVLTNFNRLSPFLGDGESEEVGNDKLELALDGTVSLECIIFIYFNFSLILSFFMSFLKKNVIKIIPLCRKDWRP